MTTDLWPAPVAARPVTATIAVPGSKSVTNRALVLAALAGGASRLRRPLRSRDTELMAAALQAMGTSVTSDGDDWVVTPARLRGPAAVDVGLAGTVMRFLPPVATLADGPVTFDGDPAARVRPLRPLVDALRSLGAEIDDDGRGGLPLTVVGHRGLRGGRVEIDASSSSQLVSALLLTAPAWAEGVVVGHVGARPVPNAAHLAMTVAMLRGRGIDVVDGAPGVWEVRPGVVAPTDEVVEPDLSSAAPFLAAAVVTGGTVRLPGWPPSTTQPGRDLPRLLSAFGASVDLGADLVVTGAGRVTGADLDLRDCGELTPVLAAVAAVADTPSKLTGIGYLRGHESDRLAALARELGGLGVDVTELDDGLVIDPGPRHGGVFHTYADHRLAMAAAVVGLVTPGVLVEDVATTAKTYPGFAREWESMLAGADR